MNRLFLEFLVSGCITIIGIAIFIRQWRTLHKSGTDKKLTFQNVKGSLVLIVIGLVCFALTMVRN